MEQTISDERDDQLHRLGWSTGEACFRADAGAACRMDATDGERVIVARAPSQAGAWRLAMARPRPGTAPIW